jgi:nicotinamide riboside kinase
LGNIVKLALIGTHGAGKTTIAYEVCSLVKRSGRSVELVREVARRSPFPVNEATTLEGQLWILHTQIAAELAAAREGANVVCDRSVLDNYCYLVNKFGRQPELETWLFHWMKSYDVLAIIGPLQEIRRDGFRSEDRAFQSRIHELLKEFLEESALGGLRERVIWLEGSDRMQWAERIFATTFLAPPSPDNAKEPAKS